MFLTAVAAAAIAVSARAQAIQAPAGQAYAIVSNVPATAVNPVKYQWYRNNSLIPDATGESYTVPAAASYGDNVAFYRMATAQECAGVAEKPSNTITITFTGYTVPVGCNLVVGGLCWADYNVDNLYTFAASSDMPTKLYQWNRLTAYSANDPLTPAWNSTPDTSKMWTVNPCPASWRVPTQDEYQQLLSLGSTWADMDTKGNQFPGRFCGHNHATCRLPSNMSNCVFFPETGYRTADGTLNYVNVNGAYWTSGMQTNSTSASRFYMYTQSSIGINSASKLFAHSIRCVK